MENKNIIGLQLHFTKIKYTNSFYTNQCPDMEDYLIVDCTSRNLDLAPDLSPFCLGPVTGPDGATAATVETFFQCGKVYPCHDDNGKPNADFFVWRDGMYGKQIGELSKADLRHPQKQLGYEHYDARYFPWYDEESGEYIPLDYVNSRKRAYIPNYAVLVSQTETFKKLKELVAQGKKIALTDFDSYNYYSEEAMTRKYNSYLNKCKKENRTPTATLGDFLNIKTMKDVVNCKFIPAGHAMIIKALLQGDLEVVDGKLVDPQGILSSQHCDSPEERPVPTTQEAEPEQVSEIMFSVGQVLQHPVFGSGEITAIAGEYLKIHFACGEKILGRQWVEENCNF